MKRTTGHLAEKNGRWYAVLNLYDADGKRREKWQSLDLEARKGTKTEANHRMNQVLDRYNSGDLYLRETMTHAERERNRIADMMSVPEAAKELRIGKNRAYELIKEGRLEAIKVGRKLIVPKSALYEFCRDERNYLLLVPNWRT